MGHDIPLPDPHRRCQATCWNWIFTGSQSLSVCLVPIRTFSLVILSTPLQPESSVDILSLYERANTLYGSPTCRGRTVTQLPTSGCYLGYN